MALIAIGLAAATSLPSPRSIAGHSTEAVIQPTSLQTPTATNAPQTFNSLLVLSPDELAKVDIARVNLLCASGLPGSDDLTPATIEKLLARLDTWAERVKYETERHLYRLTSPGYEDHAEHYQHSEARFRAEWLVNVLQQDIGVHYHAGMVPAGEKVPPFKTSKETFIHGLLDHGDAKQAFGGNCVALPVIYAAVGRRLGYPIKLVNSREHVFCRWMGDGQQNPAWRGEFNFDGAGNGFSIDPDDFYMSWPSESTPTQAKVYDWFKPLTARQELALFLMSRGHVQREAGRDFNAAQVSYTLAASLWPTNRNPLVFMRSNGERLWQQEFADHPDVYRQPSQQAQAAAPGQQAEARVPWWQSPQGRADHEDRVRRMNEYNRRLMEQQQQAHGQPLSARHPQPWSQQPFRGGATPLHQLLPRTYPVEQIQPFETGLIR